MIRTSARRDRRHGKRRMRKLPHILVYLLAAYLIWCVLLTVFQNELLFPSGAAPSPSDRLPTPDAERLFIEIEPGASVEAWFVPAPGSGRDSPAPAVIFFHGNAELIDYQDFFVDGYRAIGCSVLLPEYRGYGRSAGSPSRATLSADAVRFHDLLAGRGDVDAERIYIHGRSLGGAIAAELAAVRPPAALILQSTFSSMYSMAHRFAVPGFVVRNRFDAAAILADSDVPVLVLHGSRDRVIPVSNGRRLAASSRRSRYVEYDCGHNDLPRPDAETEYWRLIGLFLRDPAGVVGPAR